MNNLQREVAKLGLKLRVVEKENKELLEELDLRRRENISRGRFIAIVQRKISDVIAENEELKRKYADALRKQNNTTMSCIEHCANFDSVIEELRVKLTAAELELSFLRNSSGYY